MLVLSRKPGERIKIGPDIYIIVVRISPSSVRLGIQAPDHISVAREEIEFHLPEGQDLDLSTFANAFTGEEQPSRPSRIRPSVRKPYSGKLRPVGSVPIDRE